MAEHVGARPFHLDVGETSLSLGVSLLVFRGVGLVQPEKLQLAVANDTEPASAQGHRLGIAVHHNQPGKLRRGVIDIDDLDETAGVVAAKDIQPVAIQQHLLHEVHRQSGLAGQTRHSGVDQAERLQLERAVDSVDDLVQLVALRSHQPLIGRADLQCRLIQLHAALQATASRCSGSEADDDRHDCHNNPQT